MRHERDTGSAEREAALDTHVMGRRRLAVALAAGLAVAAAGCGGGGDDETLDKAALAKKANAICTKYAKEGRKIEAPKDINDADQAKAYFDKAHDVIQRQQDELEDLKPAAAVKDDYEAMTSAMRKALTLLADLADAAGSKDMAKGSELLQKVQPASDAVDKTVAAVGASACGS
jgi:hypothetical protein